MASNLRGCKIKVLKKRQTKQISKTTKHKEPHNDTIEVGNMFVIEIEHQSRNTTCQHIMLFPFSPLSSLRKESQHLPTDVIPRLNVNERVLQVPLLPAMARQSAPCALERVFVVRGFWHGEDRKRLTCEMLDPIKSSNMLTMTMNENLKSKYWKLKTATRKATIVWKCSTHQSLQRRPHKTVRKCKH